MRTVSQIRVLVKALRAMGVTRFKDGTLELELGVKPPRKTKTQEEVKHRVEELQSVMRLSDQDLVDRLFPESKEEGEPNELHS